MIKSTRLKNETVNYSKETGEIFTTSKSFSVKIDQDNFYMSYIENMSGFFNLKSAIDIKVLTKFCIIAEFNTGKVVLSPAERKEINEFLGISTQQLTNSISSLKKNNLITGEKGSYIINPIVFWKGNNDTRNDLIKNKKLSLNIEFENEKAS